MFQQHNSEFWLEVAQGQRDRLAKAAVTARWFTTRKPDSSIGQRLRAWLGSSQSIPTSERQEEATVFAFCRFG